MLGKPKYKHGEMVNFMFNGKEPKQGTIYIIDAYGTYFQREEVSYDIRVASEENCLYKHVVEKDVSPLKDSSNGDKVQIGKFLSYVLRHHPEKINLNLDPNGWAKVSELIELVNEGSKYRLTLEILTEIVETNNKERYSFNEKRTLIRANQGHSINVDVELEEKIPPSTLYHGTATKYEKSINEKGLIAKNRLHVHLSSDIDTAKTVGARHGSIVVYVVDCEKMIADNYKFYISKNNVWLTEKVPAKYLSKI